MPGAQRPRYVQCACMHERNQESVITAEFDLCEGFALIEKIQKLCDDLEGRESPSGLEKLKREKNENFFN